ncbi:MAG TPA: hypothetical protein VNP72_01535 [Longimicrobium sp.]|nr:hypothetical protein [Longimicrobium sp.]
MPYGQITISQGGVELWGGEEDGKDLYIRCLAGFGTQEIELMDASAYVGLRITIRRMGSQTVYLNPDGDHPGQMIEGSTNTYSMTASRVTIQAVALGPTTHSWEIVAE